MGRDGRREIRTARLHERHRLRRGDVFEHHLQRREVMAQGLHDRGHRSVHKIEDNKQLAGVVKRLVQPGDIVVCLGAGTISQWAYALPNELAALA